MTNLLFYQTQPQAVQMIFINYLPFQFIFAHQKNTKESLFKLFRPPSTTLRIFPYRKINFSPLIFTQIQMRHKLCKYLNGDIKVAGISFDFTEMLKD